MVRSPSTRTAAFFGTSLIVSPASAPEEFSPGASLIVSPASAPEEFSPGASLIFTPAPSPEEFSPGVPTSTPATPAAASPQPLPTSPASPPSSSHPPSPSSSSPSPSSKSTAGVAIGVSVTVVIVAVILTLIGLFCCWKKKKSEDRQKRSPSSARSDVLVHTSPTPPGSLPPAIPSPKNSYSSIPPAPVAGPAGLRNSKSWFTYEELATATGGFDESNILGEGGFGCVYKGVLPGGQLVAVKQLKVGGHQGDKEFCAEVEIISRVHHRHLVSLVGYCIADSQRLLVYDYVPNGTLQCHLQGKKGRPVMDWPTRVKIASGAARGLAYLHEDCQPRIIHRDIKSSNILLDNKFEAQVSDFGLAKLFSDTNTHVTTKVMGTFGYLAPEYASTGRLTEKSDVFSFGVVLLELVTGRKPVYLTKPAGVESLVEWARPLLMQLGSEEDLDLLADPSLNRAYDKKEMLSMIQAAAACIRHSATTRPRMGQVVRALEGEASLADLNKGVKPGHSNVYNSSFMSSDNSSSSADIKRFRQVALKSQEYDSEYSGATSDDRVNPSVSSSEY